MNQVYTMEDVRRALFKAYMDEQRREGTVEGKRCEGWCSVEYPTVWDFDEAKFLTPNALKIYSYTLGPSREHTIRLGAVDREVNYHTWESPDIFRKGVEVIESWAAEREKDYTDDRWELTEAGRAMRGGK